MQHKTPIKNLRREYKLNKLSEETVLKTPVKQFELWFDDVVKFDLYQQNAMILATSSEKGKPTTRVVLLKGLNFLQTTAVTKENIFHKILKHHFYFTGQNLNDR